MSEIITSSRDVWDYWAMPNSDPRESQKIALDTMASLPAHKKYILCQIPVGGGKSPIAVSYAGFMGHGTLGSSYILTPQRVLQRQYEESFEDQPLVSVYGKANYWCHTKPGVNCDVGEDIKPKCDMCPAKLATERMKVTPHVVLNYKLAMLYADVSRQMDNEGEEFFPVKDLMVFDECHTLEGHLCDHRAVQIGKQRCEQMKLKFYKPDSLRMAHEWVIDSYRPSLETKFNELKRTVEEIEARYEFSESKVLRPSEYETMKEFKSLKRHRALIEQLSKFDLEYIEANYVLVQDKHFFQFKEIYGARLFRQILEPKADRFLFMSSTILDFEAYAADIGLPEDEVAIINLGSEFDPDNRQVFYVPTTKMNYGWNKDERKADRDTMAGKVKKLCKAHGDDSGIIHTGSFQIAKWLIEDIQDDIPHEIVTHEQDDAMARDDAIEYFTKNDGQKPMLLVSPSLTEGLDLKDDQGRFAIFVKVPYPFLGDQWIKRRMELSNEWYQRQAMTGIIQGGGRIVRHHDDWGYVYILDQSFGYLWSQMKYKTPSWWKEAFVTVS